VKTPAVLLSPERKTELMGGDRIEKALLVEVIFTTQSEFYD